MFLCLCYHDSSVSSCTGTVHGEGGNYIRPGTNRLQRSRRENMTPHYWNDCYFTQTVLYRLRKRKKWSNYLLNPWVTASLCFINWAAEWFKPSLVKVNHRSIGKPQNTLSATSRSSLWDTEFPGNQHGNWLHFSLHKYGISYLIDLKFPSCHNWNFWGSNAKYLDFLSLNIFGLWGLCVCLYPSQSVL